MSDKKYEYRVLHDCWMYGKLYKKGSLILLNKKQAKYELLSGNIELVA